MIGVSVGYILDSGVDLDNSVEYYIRRMVDLRLHCLSWASYDEEVPKKKKEEATQGTCHNIISLSASNVMCQMTIISHLFLSNKRGRERARTNRETLSLQFHAMESVTLCVRCSCASWLLWWLHCIRVFCDIVLVAKRPSLLLRLTVTSLHDIAINTSNVLRLLLDFLFEFGMAWCIQLWSLLLRVVASPFFAIVISFVFHSTLAPHAVTGQLNALRWC